MYRRAIELRPGYADAYLNLGIELGRLGRYVEAIPAFEAAIETRSDFAEAHYNLGVTLARIGRLEDAATALESALDVRSRYPEARLALAAAYRGLGRFEDAVAELRVLLDSDPVRPEARIEMGKALSKAARRQRAASREQTSCVPLARAAHFRIPSSRPHPCCARMGHPSGRVEVTHRRHRYDSSRATFATRKQTMNAIVSGMRAPRAVHLPLRVSL